MGLSNDKVVDAFKLGRKMLVPEKSIQAFRTIESRARHVVDTNSFKFPIGNACFVPKKKFPKVIKTLEECKAEYDRLTDELIANYEALKTSMLPTYMEAAKIAYISQKPAQLEVFNIEDQQREEDNFIQQFITRINAYYPSAESLREKFSLEWTVYEIALPRMRISDSAKLSNEIEKSEIINEEYRLQTQAKLGKFVDSVVADLRNQTMDICNRIVTNIKSGKVVTGRTLTSLKDFIDKFSDLNFVGDVKIEQQLETLKKEFLNTHTTEQITDEVELQDELKRRLGELADVAADMTDISSVTGEYRRKINWQD